MKTLTMYQVDAFADRLFAGNPAAVCVLEEWLDDALMQQIALENNLSETAFVIPHGDDFAIRWFTPAVEVALCGHATLASGYVLFEELGYAKDEIAFHSLHRGVLKVSRKGDFYYLDFPADMPQPVAMLPEIEAGIGTTVLELHKGTSDLLAVVKDEPTLRSLNPDFAKIKSLGIRGLIVTSEGDSKDFVSRFFAPSAGVNEDPVTGSAHTILIPFWANRLGKTSMEASQLSQRGGNLSCESLGERVSIGGQAQLYLKGEIRI
jgi:PhzF family phenazine biosynthesis protein